MIDQIQDKTDNVEVLVDRQGESIDDYRDLGNYQMFDSNEIVPYQVQREDKHCEDDSSFQTFYENYPFDAFGSSESSEIPKLGSAATFGFDRIGSEDGFGRDDLFYNSDTVYKENDVYRERESQD